MTEAPKYPGLSYQPDAGQPANQVVQVPLEPASVACVLGRNATS